MFFHLKKNKICKFFSTANNFLKNEPNKIYNKILSTDVCIIGGGSIGMFLSSLLSKFKVDHVVLEKEKNLENLFNHPKAHYISPKTVESLLYTGAFKKDFFLSEDYKSKIENWRHYRYCEYLLKKETYYGEIDHLSNKSESSGKDDTSLLEKINIISDAFPLHIGQNKLNRILYENMKSAYMKNFPQEKKHFYIGTDLLNFELRSEDNSDKKNDETYKKYIIHTKDANKDTKNDFTIHSNFIVGCDGAHSQVRKILKIENKGDKNMQSFVNAHFISKDLASRLKSMKKDSMLHFIFNPKYVCVLISYDLDEGEFVMQIPYFPEVEKQADYNKYECEKIIRELISGDDELKNRIDLVRLNFFIYFPRKLKT